MKQPDKFADHSFQLTSWERLRPLTALVVDGGLVLYSLRERHRDRDRSAMAAFGPPRSIHRHKGGEGRHQTVLYGGLLENSHLFSHGVAVRLFLSDHLRSRSSCFGGEKSQCLDRSVATFR